MIFRTDISPTLRATLMIVSSRLFKVNLHTIFTWILLSFVCCCFSERQGNAQSATAIETIQGNQPILTTTSGIPRGFEDLLGTDGQAVCFAFLYPKCPLAQEYAPVLEKLTHEFAETGIRFVGVVCE
ncbi:MAG: hypothetical protein RLY14_2123 [Planctomycetota bacterium]|jgi:hypothetical protein